MDDLGPRDVVVLSSFLGVKEVIGLCYMGEYTIGIMFCLCMMASALYHAIVPEYVANMGMFVSMHGLANGRIGDMMMQTEFGRYCRDHEIYLLVLDEACVVATLIMVIRKHGLPSRSLYGPILLVMIVFLLGEYTQGVQHAIFHSLWHACAPAVLYLHVVTSVRGPHPKRD